MMLRTAFILCGLMCSLGVHAETSEVLSETQLRVCADPDNFPFSNQAETGFENKIAKLLADDLKKKLVYEWYPQNMGFFANTLNAFKCDIVIGIMGANELVQNTNPYYRSTYVMVYNKKSSAHPKSLQDPIAKTLRIGAPANIPPITELATLGLLRNLRSYTPNADTRYEKPVELMIADLKQNKVDVILAWGPSIGRYVKEDKSLLMVPLLSDQENTKMDFWVTMGVRHNTENWKHQMNDWLQKHNDQIQVILNDYYIPQLDVQGRLINAEVFKQTDPQPNQNSKPTENYTHPTSQSHPKLHL